MDSGAVPVTTVKGHGQEKLFPESLGTPKPTTGPAQTLQSPTGGPQTAGLKGTGKTVCEGGSMYTPIASRG